MSKATIKLSTQNQLNTDFDTKKIFRRNNRFDDIQFKNTSGGVLVMPGGTLIGRVGGTLEGETVKSASVDGSEIPLGVLANEEVTLQDGEVKQVSICVEGDVEETLVILDGGDTLDTLIDGRTIRDRIGADTVGINLVKADELTAVDNN